MLCNHTIGETPEKGRFHITQTSVFYQSLLVFGLVAVTGCETDLEKIQRLSGEQAVACLNAEIDYRAYKDAKPDNMKPATPRADSLGREWSEWTAKCELLTREYQRVGR